MFPENKIREEIWNTFKKKLGLLSQMLTNISILYLDFLFTFAYDVCLEFTMLFLLKQNHSLVLSLKYIYIFFSGFHVQLSSSY